MARNIATVIENNFSRGLITEATGLNFPENAATDADNAVFEQIGQVRRRLGIDFEADAQFKGILDLDTDGAIVEYVWRAVSRTGDFVIVVVQTGSIISFYALQGDQSLSAGIKAFEIDLTTESGIPAAVLRDIPCSFASGGGRLFIVNSKVNPIVVEYNEDTDSITVTHVIVRIRDFEGLEDGLEIDEQPVTLSDAHWYNLKNQGWWREDVRMVTPGGGAGPATIGQ